MPAGPIFSLLYVHNAIRSEAAQLETLVREATSPGEAGELAERFVYLAKLLHMHQAGEEAGLFPVLAELFPHAADTYLFDHEEERSVGARLVELAHACGSDDEEALAALQREVPVFRAAVEMHSRKEDELVFPLIAERFSPPEQGKIISDILAAIPKEEMPAAVPWIVDRQTLDDAEAYVRGLMGAMPPPVFAAARGWIEAGVASERWEQLKGRVPELTG
jgi:iron-sulfur cluster repair protein YtfE (RIC family)